MVGSRGQRIVQDDLQNNSLEGGEIGEVAKGVGPMPTIVDSRYGECRESEKHQEGGGYGEVTKVKIEGDDRVPPEITWAEKTPKTSDRQKARIQVSAEACVLKSTHPGFIKFWLINSVSNAGYTLWWNGGTLRERLGGVRDSGLNAKVLAM